MRKILYFGILLLYNLTTLYTAEVHNHQFTWNDLDTCPAYIISISHHSDTSSFSENTSLVAPDVEILNNQSYEIDLNFEFTKTLSTRAPPALV